MAIDLAIKQEGRFKYMETAGKGETLLLLHGLFGALSNFEGIVKDFGSRMNIVIPVLPIFDLPILQVSVSGLVDYIIDFVKYRGYTSVHVLGNSLGGHIALLFALEKPELVKSLILTGSSGLFESAFGTTFPRRGDYDFIKKKTEDTFYDPAVATPELIEEVYSTVNDRLKAIRVVATAKSAVRHNLEDKLHKIKCPVLLVWGKQDVVTPPFVAEKFHDLLQNSTLVFVDLCGHAPMMEKPVEFNQILETFLQKVNA